MRSSSGRTARWRRRILAPSSGFTLLEILVVMFIIGVIAAMATLSVGVATSRKGTEKEIERLEDLLTLASEEAVAQGREFGITFYAKEYQFSTWDPAEIRWKPLGEDADPFEPRSFPPETIVDLEIEGRLVKLGEERPPAEQKKSDDKKPGGRVMATDKVKDKYQPQVFMDSSGEISPFRLHLRPGTGRPGVSLRVAENGKTEQIRDER